MNATLLPDGVIPLEAGHVAWLRDVPRPWLRDVPADELAVVAPNGEFFALLPEVHDVSDAGGVISVSPSIVSPSGRYHGFLANGVWS